MLIRDCDSTNGTFVNGDPVKEAWLLPGQTVNLGDVEIFVESTEVNVAIPKFERERPKPPVVLADGKLACKRHPAEHATYQCTHCREVMCDACVHMLRRRGGKLHKFCPFCSRECVLIGPEKKKRRSLLGLWRKTIKLPFLHGSKSKQAE